MEQLILRQAAIDALRTCYDTETITMDNGDEYINYGDAVGEIEQLQPIQLEIVRCGDCKYHYQRNCPIEKYFSLNGFCSRGKRREVTT